MRTAVAIIRGSRVYSDRRSPTSTQMMLNFIASKGTRGSGFRWTKSTSYQTEKSLLAWERAHDTLVWTSKGTDPHGWRNGLNYYGWNSYAATSRMVYQDLAYTSYDAAVKAAVSAMAKFGKPVGILGWAGSHSQIMNGYEVVGEDPAVSSAFSVLAVYLTDSLKKDGLRNARISNADFQGGSLTYRFRAYARTDSPYDDRYTAGDTRVLQGVVREVDDRRPGPLTVPDHPVTAPSGQMGHGETSVEERPHASPAGAGVSTADSSSLVVRAGKRPLDRPDAGTEPEEPVAGPRHIGRGQRAPDIGGRRGER